jgi:2-dehydro-3-deoxygalactonokinase
MKPCLIALDWGSTRFRGWLLDSTGIEIDSIDEEFGILNIDDSQYINVFDQLLGSWIKEHGSIPVIASGMIGSRQGWMEVPYLDCPTGTEQLARNLTYLTINSKIISNPLSMAIVPGIQIFENGIPDVMRGEETQVAGLVWSKHKVGLCILPGTHSKWVFINKGMIENFTTFMTGEIFALMAKHSIINRLMDGKSFNRDDFIIGCKQSLNSSYGFLKETFSARTMGLFEKVKPKGIHSYLSGIIIGNEIKDGINIYYKNLRNKEETIILNGEKSLCNLYKIAFEIAGVKVKLEKYNLATKGLFQIAQTAFLK